MSHQEEYRRILRRHLEAGSPPLFTHAYCAAGWLKDDSLAFEAFDSPDGREIFDLASLTKAIATTPLVFRAAKRHGLKLEGTVRDWLAGRQVGLDERLLAFPIKSLLRHETGLPAWTNLWTQCDGADFQNPIKSHLISRLNLAADRINPTQEQKYSDVGFLLLGLVLEEREGKPLDELFRDLCLELKVDPGTLPLGFATQIDKISTRAIKTADCAWRARPLVGEVHDENCAALGGVAGHAGLFGTGRGVVSFLRRFYASDLGQEVFAANAQALQWPLRNPPNESLCGWRQGADPSSISFAKGRSMGHMGFTGVAFWTTPEGAFAVFLTNRVIGGRTRRGIAAVRREVFELMGNILGL